MIPFFYITASAANITITYSNFIPRDAFFKLRAPCDSILVSIRFCKLPQILKRRIRRVFSHHFLQIFIVICLFLDAACERVLLFIIFSAVRRPESLTDPSGAADALLKRWHAALCSSDISTSFGFSFMFPRYITATSCENDCTRPRS